MYRFSHRLMNHQGLPRLRNDCPADNLTETWCDREYTEPKRCLPKGIECSVAKDLAMDCMLVVGAKNFP
jgi:hypothetical protein